MGKAVMKKILLASVATAALCSASAFAADMPTKGPVYKAAPALYDWSGFYAGVSGGWVDGGRNDVIFLPPGVGSATSKGLSGGSFGGVYGYNWQFNNWVIGTRSDLAWSNADSTIAGCGGGTFACNDRLRWLSTTRGRLGFTAGPTGNWLIYGTGGYAWGSIRRFDTSTGGTSITESKTDSGWTWGGGIEVGLTPQWALGFEALRVDLTNSKVFPTGGVFANEHVKDTFDIYRLSLTYRFGDLWGKTPVSAKY
jgi:outer membrane immunogenic protein